VGRRRGDGAGRGGGRRPGGRARLGLTGPHTANATLLGRAFYPGAPVRQARMAPSSRRTAAWWRRSRVPRRASLEGERRGRPEVMDVPGRRARAGVLQRGRAAAPGPVHNAAAAARAPPRAAVLLW
jgi:hypothetical protein